MQKADRPAIERLQFVHCAVPDMALDKADTKYKLGEGFTLPYPIAVLAESESMARELSGKYADIPIVFDGSVLVNGKLAGKLSSTYLVDVRDGIEVAKAIRIDRNSLPCVDSKDLEKIKINIKQLMISMFLTDSKSIAALEKAPIYNM